MRNGYRREMKGTSSIVVIGRFTKFMRCLCPLLHKSTIALQCGGRVAQQDLIWKIEVESLFHWIGGTKCILGLRSFDAENLFLGVPYLLLWTEPTEE